MHSVKHASEGNKLNAVRGKLRGKKNRAMGGGACYCETTF